MKNLTQLLNPMAIALLLLVVFTSCNCNKIPKDVQELIPKTFLNEMKEAGFPLHLGDNPPVVNGYYRFDPINEYDNSDKFKKGDIALTTYFQLENQIGSKLDVYVHNWTKNGSVDSSRATIIRGDGNNFTLIAQAQGAIGNQKYIYDYIISGEKTATGVDNLQMAFVMIDHPGIESIAKVGTIRIFNQQ